MILQLIFSILLVISIFFIGFNLEVGEVGLASNLNALMIVLGGTFAATLIAYPWKKVFWAFHLLKKAFLSRDETDSTIKTIVDLARAYRQGGIRTLEQKAENLSKGLLKSLIELVVINCPKEKIGQILQKEAQLIFVQYETAYKILHNMARLAPAMGLAGTIVTLIRVFEHITDPQSLVGYMAIALFSTFYGVVLANLCFVPLSNKLREFMDQEEGRVELIQEGILDLCDEENPTAMQFKLEALSADFIELNPTWSHHNPAYIPPKKHVSSEAS